MAFSNINTIQAAQDNACRLLLMVEMAIASPTQANVDATVAAIRQGNLDNTLTLRPQTSLDGESYSWPEYKTALTTFIHECQRLLIMFGGTFISRSMGRAQ